MRSGESSEVFRRTQQFEIGAFVRSKGANRCKKCKGASLLDTFLQMICANNFALVVAYWKNLIAEFNHMIMETPFWVFFNVFHPKMGVKGRVEGLLFGVV